MIYFHPWNIEGESIEDCAFLNSVTVTGDRSIYVSKRSETFSIDIINVVYFVQDVLGVLKPFSSFM